MMITRGHVWILIQSQLESLEGITNSKASLINNPGVNRMPLENKLER
jgi:hypothetical protein